jgi:chloramphenicol-sensitive protein RarD
MAASGLATAAPLLCFATAARRIPLSTLGLLQYLGPTIQFLLGSWIYHEPFDRTRLVGFVIVWCALALFVAVSVRQRFASSAGGPPPGPDGG